MADEATQKRWLKKLNAELDSRQSMTDRLDRYQAGYPDVPEHIAAVKQETEYRVLLRQAVTNWPELIVKSRKERLEVIGMKYPSAATSNAAWDLWQRNGLDADAPMIHEAALVDGRAYAIVWADADSQPEIVPEHASTTVVAYDLPSGRRRAAALRRWKDGERWNCTLYLPDGLYKFQAKADGDTSISEDNDWERREVPGEEWPLPNPLGVVPVVEFSVNRSLSPYRCTDGQTSWRPAKQSREFGYTVAGEFERVLPIVDRINTTIFNGLLAMLYTSFPIRALIGDPIRWVEKTDSNGDPILDGNGNPVMEPSAPFDAAINRLVQIENPDGKLVQLAEADLSNFIKFAEAHIRHLAAITTTPAHYLLGDLVNISADAIRAAEAGLVSTVKGGHFLTLGESWEEVVRLAFMVLGNKDGADPSLETQWRDPESRSLAERADAATKLKDILPWQAIAERVLQATPQDIDRWAALRSSDTMLGLLNGAVADVA